MTVWSGMPDVAPVPHRTAEQLSRRSPAEEEARYGFEGLSEVILYSHEVGLAKPDRRVYALLCERLDVSPDELVFLDDGPLNVDAACQFGIHGVLHRDTVESITAINALLTPEAAALPLPGHATTPPGQRFCGTFSPPSSS